MNSSAHIQAPFPQNNTAYKIKSIYFLSGLLGFIVWPTCLLWGSQASTAVHAFVEIFALISDWTSSARHSFLFRRRMFKSYKDYNMKPLIKIDQTEILYRANQCQTYITQL